MGPEFRNRQTKLNNDDAAIQFKRDQQLYGEIDKAVRAIKVIQGAAKEPRQFLIHREQTAPAVDGSSVPIWIRDGWSCSEKTLSTPLAPPERIAQSFLYSFPDSPLRTCGGSLLKQTQLSRLWTPKAIPRPQRGRKHVRAWKVAAPARSEIGIV